MFPTLQSLTEAITVVKTIKKVATYRQEAVTKALKTKLEKHAPAFDVTVTYGKPFDDRSEGMMQTIRLEGTRENIKAFVKKVDIQMNDESLHEERERDAVEFGAGIEEESEEHKITKADVLAFLKDCDAACRKSVHTKLMAMVEADEAEEK